MASTEGRLTGRVAVVTGAASGIGAACAARFAAEGAAVVGWDVQDPGDSWEAVAKAAPAASWSSVDVTDESAVTAAVAAAIEIHDRADVLLNAAGVSSYGTVADTETREWDRVVDVNLKGTFLVSKHVVPRIVASGGGSIVNISSIEGMVGFEMQAAYNASKGGVLVLTRSMAVDYASQGVRVNCICPGFITTPLTAPLDAPELRPIRDRFEKLALLGRAGRADEVAAAAAFLASDDASFVTGHPLVVDGGFTAGFRIMDALAAEPQ